MQLLDEVREQRERERESKGNEAQCLHNWRSNTIPARRASGGRSCAKSKVPRRGRASAVGMRTSRGHRGRKCRDWLGRPRVAEGRLTTSRRRPRSRQARPSRPPLENIRSALKGLRRWKPVATASIAYLEVARLNGHGVLLYWFSTEKNRLHIRGRGQ